MVDGDIFREVEEEMRRERMKSLWDKYGVLAIGGALAIIVGVAGYQGYQYYNRSIAEEASVAFQKAEAILDTRAEREGAAPPDPSSAQVDQAIAAFETVQSKGGGYGALARMRRAALLLGKGEREQALAEFEAVTGQTGVQKTLRDMAQLRASMIKLDLGRFDDVRSELTGLAEQSSPWRHSAREFMALAALEQGDTAAADQLYNQIFTDPQTPQAMRQRAQAGIELIVTLDAKRAEKAAEQASKQPNEQPSEPAASGDAPADDATATQDAKEPASQ
ncbi:MAG: tetratricopeptide repeat protein [Pseudomonadota bacterium]